MASLSAKISTNLMVTMLLVQVVGGCVQGGEGKENSRSTTSSGSSQPAVTPLPVGGSLLVEADIIPTPNALRAKKTQPELEKFLNMARVFYVNQPESQLNVPPGFEECYTELDSFTMDANKVSAKMLKTLDISKCVKIATDQSITIQSITATLEIYFYMACTVGDISALQGKPFREMSTNLIAKSGCEEGSLHLEFLSVTNAEAVYPGGISTKFKRRTASLDGTSQLKGCKFKVKDKIETRDNECMNFAKDDYSFDLGGGLGDTFSDIYKFEFKDVTGDYNAPDNIWRSKGSIQLSVNNWTGTVKFNGATEAPQYDATEVDDNTTATGTLTATPPGSDMFIPASLTSGITDQIGAPKI
ncbi:MAG: hypothetical protein FJ146_16620 [Deltaproteobacteria bacterium]|nr:hypothetical protein [Deltaproteobacteria bacterium]